MNSFFFCHLSLSDLIKYILLIRFETSTSLTRSTYETSKFMRYLNFKFMEIYIYIKYIYIYVCEKSVKNVLCPNRRMKSSLFLLQLIRLFFFIPLSLSVSFFFHILTFFTYSTTENVSHLNDSGDIPCRARNVFSPPLPFNKMLRCEVHLSRTSRIYM